MEVNRIKSDYGTSFGLHVVNTTSVRNMKDYFARYGEVAKTELFSKIEKAMEKHPSNVYLFSKTQNLYGQKNTISGIIANANHDCFFDKTVSDKDIKAVASAWKNFLRPRNQATFDSVVGKEYSSQYAIWWTKNIMPIWKDIKALF